MSNRDVKVTHLSVLPISEEDAVYKRYAGAAQAVEAALCCPVEYSHEFLKVIPAEVLERDYGCGDPTPYVRPGETVLDLGSGGGKLCFIAAQLVGEKGRVIGVDCNDSMMQLAKSAAPIVAQRLGYANVEFRYGLIQDLQLDLERLADSLAQHPVDGTQGYLKLRHLEEELRREQPLIPDESVDCVLSNCVLNLVRIRDRKELFSEIFRVLKAGGRVAVSDIVSDKSVPEHMRSNPELWSGCISGAFREDEFLDAFEKAGFHGMHIAKRESRPWRTVEGIEFRSVTVVAYKGMPENSNDSNQALLYRGPFKVVEDDQGHLYRRGEPVAVSNKVFRMLQQSPYEDQFIAISSGLPIADVQAGKTACCQSTPRTSCETADSRLGAAPRSSGNCGESCC